MWPYRIVIFFLALTMVTFQVTMAQPKGFSPVKDLAAFKQTFARESSKIQSIESGFVQEKTLEALTETIRSRGQFWFKRSDRVRIEYQSPFLYTMVLNGDKMLVRDGERKSQVNMRSNKLFQQVNRIMIDCMQGTIMESKDFATRVFESSDAYVLELTPVTKTLREFFQVINLTVQKRDYVATSIEMNEPGGDKTTIRFIDGKLNAPVADAVFTL